MRQLQISIRRFACVLMILLSGSATWALNEPSHELINVQATNLSTLDNVMKEHLGMPNGITTTFRRGNEVNRAVDWVRVGGRREDSPLCRTARHFHDPLYQADGSGRGPWSSAGLVTLNPLVAAACGGTSFPSSVHWAQEPNQTLGERGAWQDARRFFRNALTASELGDREQAFADTFRALGQQMHLVVDASVPEHVRNDPHVMESILRGVGLRGHGSYEHWVSDQHGRPGSQQEAAFITRYLSNPFDFNPAILQQPTNDTQARVPVARLIDTDLYQAIDPNVTLGSAIGIAEFANANFFSEDTGSSRLLLPNYPFPDRNRLVPSQHPAPQPGRVRTYYAKGPGDGLPADPVLAECVLDEPARDEGILEPRTYTCVDENVWAQVVQVMLPRAIGYARGVLDYFFRGTLDFTIGGSSPNQTVTITNKTDEAMDGTFTLYTDNFSDVRTPVAGTSFNLNLEPGATSGALAFTPPAEVQAYTLVFQGKLGLEEGAVAAKVKQVPLNAFFVWQVRFYNDQFNLVVFGSTSTGACFQFLHSISASGRHTGLRRDYLFFAFVNDPNATASPLDVSALELTARISPSRPHLPQAADYSLFRNDVIAIIHPAGEARCEQTNQSSPYAPRVLTVALASQIAPEFFASTPIPPPNHYVYMDALGLFRDTGAVASEPVVLTQKLTSISLDQIQQMAQGLHPVLIPPASFPQSGAFYAFAQVDVPNVDSWELQVTDSISAIWGGTTPIASTSVAEMWDLQSLALLVSGEADINLDVLSALHQPIRGYELQWVFGPQYQATVKRQLNSFSLRHNPNDPFNPIRENIPFP